MGDSENPISASSSRDFFRVPCELQLRFRKIDQEELRVFKQFGLRPSPYSSLRAGIETELSRLMLDSEMKHLLEKAFQILLNIDQRLERIEETLAGQAKEAPTVQDSHTWVHADLSAGGIAFVPPEKSSVQKGDFVMLDLIFPALPEQRVVCAGRVIHEGKEGAVGVEFTEIHQDDLEFVHRFVLEKEREMLRTRALERDSAKT